ncbi:hypothetical protein M9458_045896, partial [Cirrhinus mrigala]
RQPTYPPTGPSHSYRLHEASLFGSASSLPGLGVAGRGPASQFVRILLFLFIRPAHSHRRLLQKNSAMGVMCQASAPYQQQQLSTPSYQRQRKLNQYPYL